MSWGSGCGWVWVGGVYICVRVEYGVQVRTFLVSILMSVCNVGYQFTLNNSDIFLSGLCQLCQRTDGRVTPTTPYHHRICSVKHCMTLNELLLLLLFISYYDYDCDDDDDDYYYYHVIAGRGGAAVFVWGGTLAHLLAVYKQAG